MIRVHNVLITYKFVTNSRECTSLYYSRKVRYKATCFISSLYPQKSDANLLQFFTPPNYLTYFNQKFIYLEVCQDINMRFTDHMFGTTGQDSCLNLLLILKIKGDKYYN